MRSAVWFFIGIIFGAAGGAYVAKSIAEKKAEDKIEKATLEARDYYKEKYEKKEEEKPAATETAENLTRIYGRAFDLYSNKDEAVIYGEEHREEIPVADTNSYRIDEDDFGMDAEYTTYTLDYYADGNLVDEAGNIVEDPVHLVGGDILDGLSIDAPVAYVRNDITKTDYEVCFVDSDYEESGGVSD